MPTTGNYIQTRVENDWLGRGPVKEITWTGLNGTGVQRVTISHYRLDGKLTMKELPNKEKFIYTYDNMGKLEKITYPDAKRTRMLYDINGNLTQTIDRRDISTQMTYNDSDMVVEKKTIDTTRGDTVITTTYTQFGPAKILQKENNNDIVENNYWYHWSGGVLKQTQVIDTYTMQIDNTFDPAGNQITTTPTGSGATPWTKQFDIKPIFHPSTPDTDNFNRTAVEDHATGNTIITYEPDFLGLAANIKYGTYASFVAKMTYTYDKYLRVKTLQSDEGTQYLDITLTRDFIGNITRRQEPAHQYPEPEIPEIDYNYTYDGMNRLSSGESASNTYDELSNLITKGTDKYIYQDIDEENSDQMRLATFDDGTEHVYTYDSNGNPTEITGRFDSESPDPSILYDNLNMLREIYYSQNDKYWYNSAGLRVKKIEDYGGTPVTTYTLFDGDNPLMQEVYNNTTLIQTTFNIIVGGKILAQYKTVYSPSQTTSLVYFYLDNLNSRRVVLDSSGTATDRYRYSAWGVATTDAGAGGYKSFTGKEYDATGLYYFNARYYDPVVGRFVTEDPSKKGTGWYGYCGNNPINAIDLKGLWSVGEKFNAISDAGAGAHMRPTEIKSIASAGGSQSAAGYGGGNIGALSYLKSNLSFAEEIINKKSGIIAPTKPEDAGKPTYFDTDFIEGKFSGLSSWEFKTKGDIKVIGSSGSGLGIEWPTGSISIAASTSYTTDTQPPIGPATISQSIAGTMTQKLGPNVSFAIQGRWEATANIVGSNLENIQSKITNIGAIINIKL